MTKPTRRVFLAAAFAAFAFGAGSAYAQGIRAIAPENGATVPLVRAEMKEYLSKNREARRAFFADEASRKAMRMWGDKPLPVTLKWSGPGNAKYHVTVKREPDGKTVFDAKTVKTEAEIWNLEIARTYSWSVSAGKASAGGKFSTEDCAPRMISVQNIPNMRDIGGRIGLGGKRLRQGLVYRSAGLNSNANKYYRKDEIEKMIEDGTLVASVPEMSKESAKKLLRHKKSGKRVDYKHLVKEWCPGPERLTAETRAYMRDTLGIKTDIDLRTDRECYGMTGSPVGDGVKWVHIPSSSYGDMGSDTGKKAFAEVFKVFLDKENYPIDFHCIAGADRTGSLAYILEALLGVDEDEMWKDWETTGLANGRLEFGHYRFDALMKVFAAYPGATPRERVEAYVKEQGFTDADIAKLRSIMLED